MLTWATRPLEAEAARLSYTFQLQCFATERDGLKLLLSIAFSFSALHLLLLIVPLDWI